MVGKTKFYPIRNKRGMGGYITTKPKRQKQDRRFSPGAFYVVAFFPKLTGIGKARLWKHTLVETLSCSREAAIAKFMDRGISDKFETWENYRRAGWKVRRIRVSDLGPARGNKK